MLDINNIIIIVLLITILEAIAQGMLKQYNKNNYIYFVLIAIVCYILICVCLIKCYKSKNIGLINCIWSGISICLMLFIGTFIFNETLYTKDIIGIILVIVGIYLIQFDGNHFAQLIS
jgi:small multidrug resistance pump